MAYDRQFEKQQRIHTDGRMVYISGVASPAKPVSLMFDAEDFAGASIEWQSGTVRVATGRGELEAWFDGTNNVQFTLEDIQEAVQAALAEG